MEIKHTQLEALLARCYKVGEPLFIHGTTGIGKSETVGHVAQAAAKAQKLDYVEWNKTSYEDKLDFVKNPDLRKKSFIFTDIRLTQMDPGDLRGLPHFGDGIVYWHPTVMFNVMSKPETTGFMFFDEMNLAVPSVQAAGYQIFLDKSIGEVSFSDNVYIGAAGNRTEDHANVFEMATPLKARFLHCTLKVPTVDDWVSYAFKHELDNRIIAYLKFKPSHLMQDLSKAKMHKTDAFPTPRSWVKCSGLLEGETNVNNMGMLASSAVGDAVSTEFKAFLKLKENIDVMDILRNPEKVSKFTNRLDLQWSLIAAVAEYYRADKKLISQVLGLCEHMKPEFSISMLRMVKQNSKGNFLNALKADTKHIATVKKYVKYLV